MYKPATGSPFSNRLLLNAVPFEDPYRNVPGGQTHPLPATPTADAIFPSFAQFLVMDPNNNSTRAQTWNATIERQFGSNWQGSVSYLGSYLDRLWGGVHQNPGVFMGLGACTLNGVSHAVCTTDANLNQRRVLYQMNPVLGAGLAYAASSLINSRLYGVAPQDPLTLALATGLLLLVSLTAAFLPAQRASTLDPMAALRRE